MALGISNLSDARYFSAYNVDWMAFPSSVDADNLAEIKEMMTWVEGPQLALEVEKWDEAFLRFAAEQLPLHGVVVHDTEVGSLEGVEIIARYGSGLSSGPIVQGQDLTNLSEQEMSSAYLDTRGLSNDDIAALVEQYPHIGIVLYGSAEEKVGYKSFDEQDALIELLMED